MLRLAGCWLVFVSMASPLTAQRVSEATVGVRRSAEHCTGASGRDRCVGFPAQPQAPRVGSPYAILASAILPGSGQALLGVNRAFPYLAVEAFSWTSYVRHSGEYRRRRNGYRDLAASVARAAFSLVRPHGDFAYYERMTHYRESGRFDVNDGGVLEPEIDTTTYNGSVWLLARRTFWTDPLVAPDTTSDEYRRAVAFYRARAYDQQFRWSWTSAPHEYSEFQRLIDASNDSNRRAMVDLGVIIANHVLSMVDAYVTIRLRRGMAPLDYRLEASLPLKRLK